MKKHLNVIGCIVALALVVAALPTTPVRAAGGSFSASYSGTYSELYCGGQPNPHDGYFRFSGTGSASFIGQSSEAGSIGAFRYDCLHWSGSATLASSHHPRNTVTVGLKGFFFRTLPCYGSPAKFSITSGTGKFAHGTGSGSVQFKCHPNGTYTDQWTGTLQF